LAPIMGIAIERVDEATDDVVQELAGVLLDAVTSGAGVSFMSDLRLDDAVEWWRKTLDASTERTVILVARDEQGIVGTVQLQPSWAPNQPHRADVAKLIVHRRGRRRGIARLLMEELESHAREQRFTLLLLDTCKGGAAEQLYSSLGWIRVGEVPHFALNPDGTWCDTVFFYKQL
jgi:ribosomal protein S18 acetylase RimI-like enzyme